MASIIEVLEMAKARVHNTLLDCNTITSVCIVESKLIIELENGRNFALSIDEVKHQAKEYIEEL
tara:strand:+ start:1535 stop:1726 length:192 start_codon:yes stop_codon:yes gene_type:complete